MAKTVAAALPKPLIYRLTEPNYTIYHRAALGGLAATVRSWRRNPPPGITAELQRDYVKLTWDDDITDEEFLRRILAASFKLTEDKMIDLPGQGIRDDRDDLRLAIHNGISGTFLQHNKMRPGEKEPRRFELKSADDETVEMFTYKAINSYAHQKAQGTRLLDEKHGTKLGGKLPAFASIPQSVVPGAMSGALELQTSAADAILLLFLMVGCPVFLLRQEKAQYCVVVPDVINLVAFASALQRMAVIKEGARRFSNTYLGRGVGGAEEAALRFLIDLQAEEITTTERSVKGCLAVAMGKVSWDKNQINRSVIAKLKSDYPEIEVFSTAYRHLGGSKIIKLNKGERFVVPESSVPELVAANLASERHWCAHFKSLVSDRKDFERMRFMQGGLRRMKEAVKDADDQAIIRAFQEAWRLTMAALYRRARRDSLASPERLIEVERERIRNAILRSKNSDLLTGWFMRFCAEATRESPSKALAADLQSIRAFIFNPRNFERFQNLCLFALVSYASEEAKTATGGNE